MLVLSRQIGSTIQIGKDVKIVVRSIKSPRWIKLGIEAPDHIQILREEAIENGQGDDAAAANTPNPKANGTSTSANQSAAQSTLEVAIVEDQPEHRELIGAALRFHGVTEPKIFSSGQAGIDGIAKALADREGQRALVLLDLGLPDMSGVDVLKALRAQAALNRVPIVILTSSCDERDVDACMNAGASAFLEKSPVFNELEDSIGSLVKFWSCNRLAG